MEQMDCELLKVQNGIALCWTRQMTSIRQVVDTRVLGKLGKWNGSRKAWLNWSVVMKGYDGVINQQLYDGVINQQLSGDVTSAEIITDVVSKVQLGSVQLYFVLIMVGTGRDVDRIASALRGWSTKAWRLLFQASMVVLAVFLDTNDVVAEAVLRS